MKKESFQGILCLVAGMIVATLLLFDLTKILHLPSAIFPYIAIFLLIIISPCLSIYVAKYGVLKSKIKNGNSALVHLHRMEIISINLMAVFVIGYIFKFCGWNGAVYLIEIPGFVLSIMIVLAGILAHKFIKNSIEDGGKKGILCLLASFVVAALLLSLTVYLLLWPEPIYSIIAVMMLMAVALCLIVYVAKYGVLKSKAEKGNNALKHLYRIEITSILVVALWIIGGIFKYNQWLWYSPIFHISYFVLAILCILAGIFAYKYFKNK